VQPLELLAFLSSRLIVGIILIALPVIGYVVTHMLWHMPRLAFFHRVTVVSKLAILTGILLGIGVVAAAENRPSMNINAVLAANGAWNIPWRAFLIEIADPGRYAYSPLWQQLTAETLSTGWILYGAAMIFSTLACAVATIVMLRGEDFVIGVFAVAYEVIVVQALTMYIILLLAYALCTFNFWTALIALGLLQYYRYVKVGSAH
jgi:hypothetical protein